MNYAIRITLPYQDCSGIISRWSERCHGIVAYQHDADDEISKTHVHLALHKSEVRAEALKRMWPDAPGKGNEFWSFKEWDVRYNDSGRLSSLGYLTYMSKGIHSPVFAKKIDLDILEEARLLWVEPVKADKVGDHSERLIQKIVCHFNDHTFLKGSVNRYGNSPVMDIGEIHKIIRNYTYRQLWREHRRVPHGSFFKIVADSSFLRICERLEIFDDGVEHLLNPSL